MAISDETLQRMIAEFGGFDLSEEELALVRPELESYLEEVENLRNLELSAVMSSRLLRAAEGGDADA